MQSQVVWFRLQGTSKEDAIPIATRSDGKISFIALASALGLDLQKGAPDYMSLGNDGLVFPADPTSYGFSLHTWDNIQSLLRMDGSFAQFDLGGSRKSAVVVKCEPRPHEEEQQADARIDKDNSEDDDEDARIDKDNSEDDDEDAKSENDIEEEEDAEIETDDDDKDANTETDNNDNDEAEEEEENIYQNNYNADDVKTVPEPAAQDKQALQKNGLVLEGYKMLSGLREAEKRVQEGEMKEVYVIPLHGHHAEALKKHVFTESSFQTFLARENLQGLYKSSLVPNSDNDLVTTFEELQIGSVYYPTARTWLMEFEEFRQELNTAVLRDMGEKGLDLDPVLEYDKFVMQMYNYDGEIHMDGVVTSSKRRDIVLVTEAKPTLLKRHEVDEMLQRIDRVCLNKIVPFVKTIVPVLGVNSTHVHHDVQRLCSRKRICLYHRVGKLLQPLERLASFL